MAAAIGLMVLASAKDAAAYVRTTTKAGTPIDWRHASPQLVLDSGENPELPGPRLRASMERAVANWTGPTTECNLPPLVLAPEPMQGVEIGFDGTHLVKWRMPGFCSLPENEDDAVCLSPSAAATTTVFFRDKPGASDDGEILEVDIELNATSAHFGDEGTSDQVDIDSVLTHELGHVLGLEHTCNVSGEVAKDDHGEIVPRCFGGELPANAIQATMYNFTAPGDTSRRAPIEDEVRGLCAMYGSHQGPYTAEKSGCAVGSGPSSSGAAALFGAVAAMACVRRRRRPRPSVKR